MTDVTAIKVAKLEQKMVDVSDQVSKLDLKVDRVLNKLDNLSELRSEIETLKVGAHNEIEVLKSEVTALKKKTFRNGWIFPSLSAVMGSIMTFLIIAFLTDFK